MASIESTALATSPTTRRPPQLRNLQPRAAAAIDFNDSDDDDGLLSADYKAQRKTERDLVEFFKTTPPPPPAPTILLSPFPDDDKKKKGLLQRLRPRKGSASLGSTNGSRSSVAMSGNTSSISTRSTYTMNNRSPVGSTVGMEHGAEVATLPNGKKYVMIAVDYKNGTGAGAPTSIAPASTVSVGGQARLSTDSSRQRGTNAVGQQQHPNIQVTTTIDDKSSIGPDKRRSIIIQAGGGDGAAFSLEHTPFLLDNFALDMDYILHPSTNTQHTGSTPSSPSTPSPRASLSSHYHQIQQPQPQHIQNTGQVASAEAGNQHQHHIRKRSISTPSVMHPQQTAMAAAGQPHRNHHRTSSSKSGQSNYSADDDLRRQGSRQRNKVTFSTAMQHIHPREEASRARDDEQIVADALMRRLAAYKAQQGRADAKELSRASSAHSATTATDPSHQQQQDQLTVQSEITLPKPVSRRKVRHVQIQTQHCIMRPMYTQTEPLADEYEPREWPSPSRSTTTTTTTTAMMTTTIATTTTTTTGTSTGTDTGTDTTESLATLSNRNSSSSSSGSSVALTCSTATAAAWSEPANSSSPTTTMMTMTNGTAMAVIGRSPTTFSPQDMSSSPQMNLAKENEQLRQQVAALQSQMQKLERELASETRARARTTAAMQDTREKFEMLSAMAYKKLKELIFQRHVLEMEVRELRVQVDIQNDEQDLGHHHHHQHHHHHHHQQQPVAQVAG
ncbi:hypothetical protein BGZ73_002525 [Actinomortierella ambigua]|nr:hypothetical protein BGZ73_002525 [Actinomortierella ambigua]